MNTYCAAVLKKLHLNKQYICVFFCVLFNVSCSVRDKEKDCPTCVLEERKNLFYVIL